MVHPAPGQPGTNAWGDSVDVALAAISAAWQTYTPAWTAATTAPALGNGTITGRYTQIGKTVYVAVMLAAGTTTTFGSGVYKFSLPVAPNQSVVYYGAGIAASGSSGTQPITAIIGSGLSTYLYFYTPATTTPFALSLLSSAGVGTHAWTATASNMIRASITYQAA